MDLALSIALSSPLALHTEEAIFSLGLRELGPLVYVESFDRARRHTTVTGDVGECGEQGALGVEAHEATPGGQSRDGASHGERQLQLFKER